MCWSAAPAPSGCSTTLALRSLTEAGQITVVAKHGHQRELARALGATDVVAPDEVLRGVRRSTRAFHVKPEFGRSYLLGGVDVAIDAVGSKQSLETALHATKAGGRVVLSGMPAAADLSAAWFRELEVVGAYASAQREPGADGRGAFDIATELAGDSDADRSSRDRRRQLSAAPLARGARPCALGRPARYREGRIRPKEQQVSRPGFVLEVDDRTPPIVVHEGEGFRLEDFPLGTRVVYPPESLPGHPRRRGRDPARPAQPRGLRPAARAAQGRDAADDRVRRHLDPAAADAQARHPAADHRGRPHDGGRRRRRRRRADQRERPAPSADRRPSSSTSSASGCSGRSTRRACCTTTTPRTTTTAAHRADRPGRGRRDQPARRRVGPARLRQRQPGRDGRRPQVGADRARVVQEPASTTTTRRRWCARTRSWTTRSRTCTTPRGGWDGCSPTT